MQNVFEWIGAYGPGALLLLLLLGVVGLPVPDETLLVFSGYLIFKGKLHAPATFLAALVGSWCGISLSFTIGRTLGLGVIHRFGKYLHVDDQRREYIHAWFNRRGHWALFIGYYIAGVRHLTAIIAGASGVEFRTLVFYGWTGGLLWVSTFLAVGYFLGEEWRPAVELLHRYMLLVSLIVIAASGVYAFWRWKKSAEKKPSKGVPQVP